jgi:hypothetical protein
MKATLWSVPGLHHGRHQTNNKLTIKVKMVITTNKTKLSKSIKSSLIAPCGMNCRLCYAYIREKKACPGCYGNDDLKSITATMCRIKNCEILKAGKSRYCFKCENFPCDRMIHLDKRYRTKYGMSMINSLETIKQVGIRNFIKQEEKKWTCPKCGEIICVHKRNCIYCGYHWH